MAIAATTQIGDQGLTIGRVGRPAGRPAADRARLLDRPDVRRRDDRRDHHARPAIAFGAYDVAIAGGVEHMGHHPMGEGVDPNPRILSEKLVDPDALVMGKTAENLHDRFPGLTKERADAYAVASQDKLAAGLRGRQDPARPGPVATRSRRAGLGPGHRRRAAAPRHDDRGRWRR